MKLRRLVFLRIAAVASLTIVVLTAGASIFVLTSYRAEMTALEQTRLSVLARRLSRPVLEDDRVQISDLLHSMVRQNRFWRYAFVLEGETCLASTLPGNPPAKLMNGSRPGGAGFTLRDRRGEVITEIAAPIPHTIAVLHMVLDRAAIDRSAWPLLARIGLAGLCGLVLGWVLAAWTAQRASREVKALTALLRSAMDDAEADPVAAPANGGEVAELVELFDQQMQQRRHAVAELERHKRFLDNIVEALTHPFYVIDATDYTVRLANSAAQQCGIATAARCYQVTHGRTSPCEGDDHPCPLETVRATGRPTIIEHEHVAPDGRRQIVEIRGYPILDASGNVTQMIEYAIDITERKEAEQALKESEARYERLYSMARLMADNLPDLLWAKDLEGRYLFANRALCERVLMASSTEEVIGKTDAFFAKRELALHPDDHRWLTFDKLCSQSDAAVLESGETVHFEECGYVRGRYVCYHVHKAPLFDEDGRLIGTVGSARDITKEYAVEEERRLL
ncbi:MAG TPA: PAS domain S-box protein, partial [Acidobacteria bacterium]|nr:PAS domain S-box protein [Acidobacteriota bacterium]